MSVLGGIGATVLDLSFGGDKRKIGLRFETAVPTLLGLSYQVTLFRRLSLHKSS